jgi:hypothetical protein
MEFAYLGRIETPLTVFDGESGSAKPNGGARNKSIVGGK